MTKSLGCRLSELSVPSRPAESCLGLDVAGRKLQNSGVTLHSLACVGDEAGQAEPAVDVAVVHFNNPFHPRSCFLAIALGSSLLCFLPKGGNDRLLFLICLVLTHRLLTFRVLRKSMPRRARARSCPRHPNAASGCRAAQVSCHSGGAEGPNASQYTRFSLLCQRSLAVV